jgi:hypothetical protein
MRRRADTLGAQIRREDGVARAVEAIHRHIPVPTVSRTGER